MKKIIAILLGCILVLSLAGCDTTKAENETNNSVNLEELKEQYPEYFEMSTFKGIEVYVWQMAEDSYRCGMMSGTNRTKTFDEISELQFKSLSIEEAKAILAEIGVPKDYMIIIPVIQPYSGYAYTIDDAYIEEVSKLFE